MFHMLSCFNLAPGTSVDDFGASVRALAEYMQDNDMVCECSPVGRRVHHPVMDTDSERSQDYYFVMTFRDRAQCDRAVSHIEQLEEPGTSIHKAVYSRVRNGIFTCWEDLQAT